MSRPLQRGQSGGGASKWQDYKRSFGQIPKEKLPDNGAEQESRSPIQPPPLKTRKTAVFFLIKLSIVLSMAAAVLISLYWTVSISMTSRGKIHSRIYRRLQEQLVADLQEIGQLSHLPIRSKELDWCPPELENYVPCYNISGDSDLKVDGEIERRCLREYSSEEGCVVAPPSDYRIPLRWPTGRDFIWKDNVKISGEEFSSGSLTKRMMVEEEHIVFHSNSLMVNGMEDYVHQIAEMIELRSESDFNRAGVKTVLDIGCGFGSFGAYLFSKKVLTMCIADYEASGSQVQITLERGLPAMIASLLSKQLPYPSLSFDMVHCAQCLVDWSAKDGIYLLEVNRVLRPGGYFVWTSSLISMRSLRNQENRKKWDLIRSLTESFCWDLMTQQEETVIWKKTDKKTCYKSRKSGPEICSWTLDVECPYYKPLSPCIGGTRTHRWVPIELRRQWPSVATAPESSQLSLYGVTAAEFAEDEQRWKSGVSNYWALLSPLIFSDHPKRPGDEDPSPPSNMVRNVMDMNAQIGGFTAALLAAGKSVWVMNVVPTSGLNRLPLIVDRGFLGVRHDWCDAFPSYPRTYDMLHADRLLSSETFQKHRCSFLKLFLEMDRLLRPEGWVIIRDNAPVIESGRTLAMRLKWDCRRMEMDANTGDSLLLCQKPFLKKPVLSLV
ncbi:S-adenosyl-L-methionine-dependent methyltransferases superfamily protein [Wolffia australiana]